MKDGLDVVWACLDSPLPLFAEEEVASWEKESFAQLEQMRILVPAPLAETLPCPTCASQHVEEVIVCPNADRAKRYFLPCPEALRVEVPERSLQRWTIDHRALGHALASTLKLTGTFTVTMAGRLWKMGHTNWNGESRAVFLARGFQWPDGLQVAKKLISRPIVLVGAQVPPLEFWPGVPHAVVSLRETSSMASHGLAIDHLALAGQVNQLDAINASIQPLTLTTQMQKKLFAKAARTVLNSHLEDDVLVAAYLAKGSYRKAAEDLTKEGPVEVNKDEVFRAVKRAGGPKAVRENRDSHSTKRTVASQSRDRKKKFSAPR